MFMARMAIIISMPDFEKPLKGLRVLELASVLAGPSVGFFLAELGAEVTKIENLNTGGDITRKWKNNSENPLSETSDYYVSVNHLKKSILLNLQHDKEYQKMVRYLSASDIVISNLSPRQEQKLKLDLKTIKRYRPNCIVVSIRGYSKYPERAAFDNLIQAESGWMWLNRNRASQPTKLPIALMDIICGNHVKQAVLLALLHRLKTKKGSYIQCSLMDSALSSLNHWGFGILQNRIPQSMTQNQHASIAPYGGCYASKDQKLFTVAVGNDAQFKNLCVLLKCKKQLQNPLFKTNLLRIKNQKVLNKILADCIKKFNSGYLTKSAFALNVPLGQILKPETAIAIYKDSPSIKTKDIPFISSLPFKIDYD